MKEYCFDVVVLGAGTAGSAAAIAAADSGASVIVVEQFGSAGGSGSLGLVTPLMSTGIKGNPQCSYIGSEIISRLTRESAADGDNRCYFDPMMLSVVLEEMLFERGVKMLYHTMVTGVEIENGHINGVKVSNISGTAVVRAKKRYIDCTGDAVVCDFAGLTTLHGDDTLHKNQPCSLRYMLGGVDTGAFWEYLTAKRGQPGLVKPENFCGAVTLGGAERALDDVFRTGLEAGELSEDDCAYWQFFTVPGRSDAIALNCPEFFDIDDIADADNQSLVEVQGKIRILKHLRFYRKHLPGFEHAHIAQIASMVGIRESRRAVTEYVLTVEDAYGWRKFEDGIAQTNYPVDIHGRSLNNRQFTRDENETRRYYEVPLRSLIVKGADNLLVAGRNVGAEFVAQSSVRVIPTCRAMGEAAGIAAALGGNDGRRVRAEMIKRGAEFAE